MACLHSWAGLVVPHAAVWMERAPVHLAGAALDAAPVSRRIRWRDRRGHDDRPHGDLDRRAATLGCDHLSPPLPVHAALDASLPRRLWRLGADRRPNRPVAIDEHGLH